MPAESPTQCCNRRGTRTDTCVCLSGQQGPSPIWKQSLLPKLTGWCLFDCSPILPGCRGPNRTSFETGYCRVRNEKKPSRNLHSGRLRHIADGKLSRRGPLDELQGPSLVLSERIRPSPYPEYRCQRNCSDRKSTRLN